MLHAAMNIVFPWLGSKRTPSFSTSMMSPSIRRWSRTTSRRRRKRCCCRAWRTAASIGRATWITGASQCARESGGGRTAGTTARFAAARRADGERRCRQGTGSRRGGERQVDPVLTFTPPSDGIYFVRVSDRFRTRGGPKYAYRLRMVKPGRISSSIWVNGPPRGGASTDVVTLPRGGQARLHARPTGSVASMARFRFELRGCPPASRHRTIIAAGQSATDITLATTAFRAGAAHLTIHGTATIG